MASIPNQKTILKTIKSQVESLDTVINVIVKAASSKTIAIANTQLSNIKVYQTTLAALFDKKGILTLIIDHTMKLSKIQSMKLPNYKWLKKMTKRMLDYINDIANLKIDTTKLTKVKDQLTPVTETINSIVEVFDKIANIKIPGLFTTKFFMIKLGLWRITKLSGMLTLLNSMSPIMISSKISLALLNGITNSLAKIFGNIEKINIGLFILIKLRIIRLVLNRLMGIIRSVDIISRYIKMHGGLKDSLVLATVFNMIESVFTSIHSIRVGIFIQLKLYRILRALNLVRRIAIKIGRMFISGKSIVTLILLQSMFIQLGLMFMAVILVTPIVLLAIPAAILLLVGIKVFAFVFRFIVITLAKLALKDSVIGMLALTIICGMLLMVGMMLLMLSTVTETIMKSIWSVVKFILVVSLIVLLMAGIGFLFALLSPVFIVIGIGLTFMVMVIGVLFLMAVMLRFIQMLDLDIDKIKENVRVVIDTCKLIIDEIFNTKDTEAEKSDKGWIESLLGFVGNGLTFVLQAVLAVSYLATMMAGVLAILLMATMLRLIQELELEPDKILENVKIVINTCKTIIDALFNENTNDPKGGNKSWLESLLSYIGSGLVMVIQAIFAVAFLMMTVIAVAMILLIVTQLRLLQEIELDAPSIINNVRNVIDTAILVIRSLFDRDEEKDKESSKGFLLSIIELVSPNLVCVIQAIMAVAFLAMSVVAILLITLLAGLLRGLQEIELDGESITNNVEIVCKTAQLVINSLYNRDEQPDKQSSKGWIRKLLEFIGFDGLLKIADAIMAMAWLGMTVGVIAIIHMLAKQLSDLSKITLDSESITKKVEDICNTADRISGLIQNRKSPVSGSSDNKSMKIITWLFPRLTEIAETLSKMRWVSGIMSTVGVVSQIVNTLKTIEDLPNISGIYDKAKYVCDTADKIAKMITTRTEIDIEAGNNRLSFIERLNTVLKDLTEINPHKALTAEKALEGHMKFIEKINTMDITKLETSAKLFEHISEFSKSINGNFTDLASAINEELLPILERLEDVFDKTNDLLTETTKNTTNVNTMMRTSGITNTAVKDLTDDQINKIVNAQYNNSIWSDSNLDGVDSEVKKNMIKGWLRNERERAQLGAQNNIGEKLDMLYDLFCGLGTGQSQYARVKILQQ